MPFKNKCLSLILLYHFVILLIPLKVEQLIEQNAYCGLPNFYVPISHYKHHRWLSKNFSIIYLSSSSHNLLFTNTLDSLNIQSNSKANRKGSVCVDSASRCQCLSITFTYKTYVYLAFVLEFHF